MLTLAFLALAAGWHLGLGRRAPDFRVETAGPRATAEAAAETAPVDLNTADAEALKALSGVGDVLAERIVADREANGPFRRVEDLARVSGVGAGVLEANRGRVTVGETEGTE